jgi:Lon protease-like protein
LFPLGTVLVPEMSLSLHVFEPRYRKLIADLQEERPEASIFGVVALRQGWEVGEFSKIHDVGTTARITDLRSYGDGRYDLAVIGEHRFVIEGLDATSQPYLVGSVRYLHEPDGEPAEVDLQAVRRAWTTHLAALGALTGESLEAAEPPRAARAVSYAVAQLPSLPLADRQHLLTCRDTADRLAAARRILRRENTLMRTLHAIPATAANFRSGLGRH